MEIRLSLAELSRFKPSQVVCMSKLQTTTTWSQLSRASPCSDLIWLLSNLNDYADVLDFQAWIRRPVSASDHSELYLYIPENLSFTFLISQRSTFFSILYYLLRHLEFFISLLSPAFQHALLTTFASLKLGLNNLGRLRCSSRISLEQEMYQLCL
jgi:hypothetical protein